MRVYGPYQRGGTYRVILVGTRRVETCFSDEATATTFAAEQRRACPEEGSILECINAYVEHQEAKGLRPRTRVVTESALRSFAGDDAGRGMRRVTATWLAERVAARRTKCAVDTVATELRQAKTWLRWAAKTGKVDARVVLQADDVRVEGPRKAGAESKAQLTLDEARRYLAAGLTLPPQEQVAALAPLLMGVDGHEIVDRVVRDLDDDGRVLIVPHGKTRNRRRRVEVPEVLQAAFGALAHGRGADALLLPAGVRDDGSEVRRSLNWALCCVTACASAAGVPRVVPHGLRGTHATLAESAGATPEAVAATLGHGSTEVAGRHYTAPGTRQAQRQRHVLGVLQGGRQKTSPDSLAVGGRSKKR